MRIGLTGSMGAGKSTVYAMLSELGFTVIDADRTAHAALGFHKVISELKAAFGAMILDEGGEVNRKALARVAFTSEAATKKLNSIVHPSVFSTMLRAADAAEAEGRAIIVFDVPLLFETGFEKHCDRVICITANDEVRYERIMLRDGLSREEAASRLARQMPQAEKAALSDAVIDNSGSLSELRAAVFAALNTLCICVSREEDDISLYISDEEQ